MASWFLLFFFQAEDGIRGGRVTGVQTCALPISTVTSRGLVDTCCAHYAQPTPSGEYVLLEDEVGIGLAGGVHILRADGCDGVNACTLTQVGFWSAPIPSPQAMAIMAEIKAGVSTYGVVQRFFTRDVHNLDVQEDRFLAPSYSSGLYLVDMSDKKNPH